MKLVVKPPASTTISTGRPCHKGAVPCWHRNLLDRIAGGQPEGEAGAHDAGEGRHQKAALQIEFTDGVALLLFRDLALLGDACQAGEGDADQAHGDARQNRLSRCCPPHLRGKHAAEDGREQRTERGGVAERHRHAERHAQVPHGQTEGQAAETPQQSERVAPEKAAAGSLVKDAGHVVGQCERQDPRRDHPTEHAAGQPVRLPGPVLDAAIGHIETAGSETAQPVETGLR